MCASFKLSVVLLSVRRVLLIFGVAGLVAGCVPQVARETSTVKSESDVKITVGTGQVREPEPEPPTPSSASSSSSGSLATASASPAGQSPAASSASVAGPSTAAASPAVSAQQAIEGPAKLIGRVTVSGAIPSLPLKIQQGAQIKDAVCAEHDIPDPRLSTSAEGGLADVVIYMAKTPTSQVPAPEGETPEIDQKGCVFIPHILVCRVGQPISLLNSDPVAHNVNFTGLSDQFNQILGENQSAEYSFRRPARQPIPVKCDIHGWMSAHILPIDHPWAAVTDAEGRFEIANLPDGEHEFIVWHEAVGFIERALKVRAQQGVMTELPLAVDIGKFKL